MFSSPIAFPLLSTIDNLSPSGSDAKPKSEFVSITLFFNKSRFSGIGSAPLLNAPLSLQKTLVTLQFNFSKTSGRIE